MSTSKSEYVRNLENCLWSLVQEKEDLKRDVDRLRTQLDQANMDVESLTEEYAIVLLDSLYA